MDETIVGVLGSGVVLIFFLLNQFHKIDQDSIVYDTGNFVGSLLLVVYALLIDAWPFFVLNSVWMIFSMFGIFTDIKKKLRKAS